MPLAAARLGCGATEAGCSLEIVLKRLLALGWQRPRAAEPAYFVATGTVTPGIFTLTEQRADLMRQRVGTYRDVVKRDPVAPEDP